MPAGPIAVPVTVEADLQVALQARGELSADTELRQELEVTGGLAYSGGDLEPIHRFRLGYTFERPRIETLEGSASVRLGPRLKLEVAGVAGPYLDVSGTADLEVKPLSDPFWALYGGLSVRGGLSLFGLKKDLELYSDRLDDPIATAQGGGFIETPPELAAPPPTTRGLGRIFPRPDLTEAPLDTLPPGTPLSIVCGIEGPPVTSSDASSGRWYGLADGTFANGSDVAGGPPGGLPGCIVPPPTREEPQPAPRPRPQQPRPRPQPPAAAAAAARAGGRRPRRRRRRRRVRRLPGHQGRAAARLPARARAGRRARRRLLAGRRGRRGLQLRRPVPRLGRRERRSPGRSSGSRRTRPRASATGWRGPTAASSASAPRSSARRAASR